MLSAAGYGRKNASTRIVTPHCDPEDVGDEPLLIARRTGVPVAVSKRRTEAINLLRRESDCDIFVSDDGLQHYSLASDSVHCVNRWTGKARKFILLTGLVP